MTTARSIRNLALIGFMGTGKTTLGHQLAAQLHYPFLDTDHLIERAAGKTITEIFAADGEAAFRELEAQVLRDLAAQEHAVIATGGGLACHGDNLEQLKTHAYVVCLWAAPEVIYERVRRHTHRPLLQDPDPLGKIKTLLAAREPYYRQADLLISTDARPARDMAQHIVREFQQVLGT